jgi:hypothetical protein
MFCARATSPRPLHRPVRVPSVRRCTSVPEKPLRYSCTLRPLNDPGPLKNPCKYATTTAVAGRADLHKRRA